jgi:hypothetical protein
MLTYKKLPKGTPDWLTYSILILGGFIGIAISAETLIAIIGISGFLFNLFYPTAGFVIDPDEAVFLGVTGLSAAFSATLVSFMAVHMNRLSKKALPLSKIVWIPLAVTALLVNFGHIRDDFTYGFAAIWVWAAFAGVVFGGVLPWLLLRTKAAQKVHNK